MIATFLAVVFGIAAVVATPSSDASEAESHADTGGAVERFAAFIQEHGREYSVGSTEYERRFVHFKDRLAAVDAQNSQSGQSWRAVVNHLADRTPPELAMLRGYRHSSRTSTPTGSLGLAATSARTVDLSELPTNFTWQGHLAAMREVRDQSSCGSCWAISSSTVLRAHAELYQKDRTFSTQQIVECTPNPNECGGQGGCRGATAELAMEYAVQAGLVTEEDHGYLAKDGACPSSMQPSKTNLRSIAKHGVSLPQIAARGGGGASFGMTGWKRLAENKVAPLLEAVYKYGPVVVSVSATDAWSMYDSGIMTACDKGAVINHAVVLVGYGKAEHPFWQIQNSWGGSWGEGGFIRLVRHTDQEEDQYCGWDEKPSDGTGCKGGPSKVFVCGSCGILYDNVVPLFKQSPHGFMSRHVRDSAGIFTELSASAKHLRH